MIIIQNGLIYRGATKTEAVRDAIHACAIIKTRDAENQGQLRSIISLSLSLSLSHLEKFEDGHYATVRRRNWRLFNHLLFWVGNILYALRRKTRNQKV